MFLLLSQTFMLQDCWGEGQKKNSGSVADKQRNRALGLSYVPSPM